MPVYRVVVEVTRARALCRPVRGSYRYGLSLFQRDRDRSWCLVNDPGHVANLCGWAAIAVEGWDVEHACNLIGREMAIPVDDPPEYAPAGVAVGLGPDWVVRSAVPTASRAYAHATNCPRIRTSALLAASVVPVLPVQWEEWQ